MISMSSFRSVSLCGALSDRACFDTSYQIGAGTAEGMLEIAMAPSFWRNAHEKAGAREWEAAVGRLLRAEQPELRTALHSWLIAQGPAGIVGAVIPNDGVAAERLTLLMPALQRRATEVLGRRTVFLLPEGEADLGWLAKLFRCDVAQLVETLAEQLYQLLENEQAEYFTFVRIGQGDGKGLLDRFIEQLHSRLTGAFLDHVKISRPGPVLFIGPTGTGKSYGARLLAKMMGKTNFVHVNLSAVTETTLESRIRGYVAGAFTDASRAGSPGWFEKAKEGILFLDEFQSVPVAYQTQLLDLLHAVTDRVTVARMGEDANATPANVKVILAVNEDIDELLDSARLRRDLFFRMRHLVRFPTLHQRFSDPQTNRSTLGILLKTYRWRLAPRIAAVAEPQVFKAAVSEDELTKQRLRSMFPVIEEAAAASMLKYTWPGNLRELERVADDIFCDCDNNSEETPVVRKSHVDEAIGQFAMAKRPAEEPGPSASSVSTGAQTLLSDVESTLRANGFIIARALAQLKKTHPMYSLRSRRSLRSFLAENMTKLSDDVRTDRKMLRFMQVGNG